MVSRTYIEVDMLTAGAGLWLQTATTPGTKDKVVRVAEIRPIASVRLSFTTPPFKVDDLYQKFDAKSRKQQ